MASITSSLVAYHMAIVHACDKRRESVLVSCISAPILAFGTRKQWNKRKLSPLLTSIRTSLLRGIVNEGTLGEISAMVLLLKSMDVLNAGLSCKTVSAFLKQLLNGNTDIRKMIRVRKHH